MVNAASCDLPIEMPPFALAESGPDSANEKGVFFNWQAYRLIGHGKCDIVETELASDGMDSKCCPYQVA